MKVTASTEEIEQERRKKEKSTCHFLPILAFLCLGLTKEDRITILNRVHLLV